MRRLTRITAYTILSVLAALLLLGVAAFIRLSQGPVPLDFLSAAVESQINANLPNMTVSIGGVVIERGGDGGVPHVRLRNVELKDKSGNLVARAPRAAIGIREADLLYGDIVPTSIELIGPRIRIMRNLEGTVELGFGQMAPEDEAVVIDPTAPAAKSDAVQEENSRPGGALIEVLSGDPEKPGQGKMGSIETIRVAEAEIRFYDEANDAIWNIPRAELVFQRMPYGFAVAANANVSNGDDKGTWSADLSASYRRDTRSFSISTRISDLVPANVSDEIFALSQLARVKVPLAGHVEMEVTDTGLITKATAEFQASAGEVALPDYLAEPLIVDEGSLRADYDPVTGSLIITDSTLLVGSSRAQVKGSFMPVRSADGRLTALKIVLEARNVAIDAQGSNKEPVAVDRVDFIGKALIDEARLDIEDLMVMSGGTGIRLRGSITGGEESPGVLLSGRIKDVSSTFLKQIWPPIVTPKTRTWVHENIRQGRITDGELLINLPVDAMAKAQRTRTFPKGAINLSFKMKDVKTGYFKDLPPLLGASGEAHLIDNDFSVSIDGADVVLPSGLKGRLTSGSMYAKDILAVETMADFDLNIEAGAQAVLQYMDLPALDLLQNTGLDPSKLAAAAKLKVKISFPMIKPLPKERIDVSIEGTLSDATFKGALPDIDITRGQIALTVAKGIVNAKGPANVAGIPSEITWQRGAAPAFLQSATIKTTLDGEQRQKLGVDLGTFVRGPIGVSAVIPDLADPQGRMDIEADLSNAEMRIQPISWYRPATPKTSATLSFFTKGDKGQRVENLVIKGSGLSIKGDAVLAPKRQGLRSANFSDVMLSDENRFSAAIKAGDTGTDITITGKSFDARPLIRSLFGSRNSGDAASEQKKGQAKADTKGIKPMRVNLNLDRIIASRGEVITGANGSLTARGSILTNAEISGAFLSGQPVVFRVTPVEEGREMRINGRDGGAAIRAANLYSKVAGGQIEFYALLSNSDSSVKRGQLVLRNFEVRNEAALAELDAKGKPKKDGPRSDALSFKKLTLPFTSDARFIRIGESLVRGPELGATAEGVIRKSDGAVDITGTIIPAYALNAALGGIPVVGDILTGGKGQGIIGVTFALGGTVDKPVFQMNPMSAVAPGIFRKFFEYGSSSGSAAQRPAGRKN